jgi:hypothetical protein
MRKATISFVMSVCLSVCLAVWPHETTRLPLDGFSWNLIFDYFLKMCRAASSFIKLWKRITHTLHEDLCAFRWYLAELFLEWEIFPVKVVRKIKTRILWSVIFFPENGAVYEIIWKNMIGPHRPQMDNITRHIRCACWINKATDTLKICDANFFPRYQWLRERASYDICI